MKIKHYDPNTNKMISEELRINASNVLLSNGETLDEWRNTVELDLDRAVYYDGITNISANISSFNENEGV